MTIYKVIIRRENGNEERYFTEEQNAREFAKYHANATVYKITPCTDNNNQITWWRTDTI